MPRRQFKADVADLCRRVSTGSLPNVWAANCDDLDNDEFVVTLMPGKRQDHNTRVRILCGDADIYPNSSKYFFSIDGPHGTAADAAFLASFQSTSHRQGSSKKQTVLGLVRDMSEKFASLRKLPGPDHRPEQPSPDHAIPFADGGVTGRVHSNTESYTYNTDDWSDDESVFDFNDPLEDDTWAGSQGHGPRQQTPDWSCPLSQRISRDLQAVVRQGYRFGILQGMTSTAQNHLLSVSVRVSALGLSRQTLLAWDLDPAVYVVLLIRIEDCYTPYEALATGSSRAAKVSFRIGKCKHYKPSLSAARDAFGTLSTKTTGPRTTVPSTDPGAFSKIMITNSLNTFMSNSFLPLSKYRDDHDCSWADALGALRKQTLGNTAAPGRIGKDGADNARLSKATNVERSFPLVAMQFAIDQVINCTRYCQACHARMDRATQSIKPTVCSDSLCLFQYIQMGMGRSTEHEILAQPAVVDLLVSFCYAALYPTAKDARGAIRTLPENIGLEVVDLSKPCPNLGIYRCQSGRRPHVLLRERCHLSRFHVGDWVAIVAAGIKPAPNDPMQCPPVRHAVVIQVDTKNSTLYLSHGTYPYCDTEIESACVYRHDTPFEDIGATPHNNLVAKTRALRLVLDTLPPIAWIRMHLERHTCTSLRAVPGVSSSAARLLEWILATNRSCILEIQCPELDFGSRPGNPPQTYWTQFSFLHGSPDADARFQEARQNAAKNRLHPTLLAWHGSAIGNWHSILRTGLDYEVVNNGRTFGDGVYFSPLFDCSRVYAKSSEGKQWDNSQFNLKTALSLNEVVNAPGQFQRVAPHYVVPQRDWHQCRVLLVGSRKDRLVTPLIIDKNGEVTMEITALPLPAPIVASRWFEQDMRHTAYGPNKSQLRVPIDLIPAASIGQPGRGPESSRDGAQDGNAKEDEARADMDAEDLAFCLLDGGATAAIAPKSQPEPAKLESPPSSSSIWSPLTASTSRVYRKSQHRAGRARSAQPRLEEE